MVSFWCMREPRRSSGFGRRWWRIFSPVWLSDPASSKDMTSHSNWHGLLPILVTEAIVAVKKFFTRLLIRSLTLPPELACVYTFARCTKSWSLSSLVPKELMRLPSHSTSPFCVRNPLTKFHDLLTIVDVLL